MTEDRRVSLWTQVARSERVRRSPCRRSLRAAVAVPARLVTARASDILQTPAVVENLSDGGTLVRSAQRFEEGDRIRVCLRPGTEARISIEGEVVHARTRRYQSEALYGVRFVDLSDDQTASLGSYVRDLMQAQFMRTGARL